MVSMMASEAAGDDFALKNDSFSAHHLTFFMAEFNRLRDRCKGKIAAAESRYATVETGLRNENEALKHRLEVLERTLKEQAIVKENLLQESRKLRQDAECSADEICQLRSSLEKASTKLGQVHVVTQEELAAVTVDRDSLEIELSHLKLEVDELQDELTIHRSNYKKLRTELNEPTQEDEEDSSSSFIEAEIAQPKETPQDICLQPSASPSGQRVSWLKKTFGGRGRFVEQTAQSFADLQTVIDRKTEKKSLAQQTEQSLAGLQNLNESSSFSSEQQDSIHDKIVEESPTSVIIPENIDGGGEQRRRVSFLTAAFGGSINQKEKSEVEKIEDNLVVPKSKPITRRHTGSEIPVTKRDSLKRLSANNIDGLKSCMKFKSSPAVTKQKVSFRESINTCKEVTTIPDSSWDDCYYTNDEMLEFKYEAFMENLGLTDEDFE